MASKVLALWYALEDGDRIVAGRLKGKLELLAIKERRVKVISPRVWRICDLTCCMAGLAALWDRTAATVIVVGTEPSLGLWNWPYPAHEHAEAAELLQPMDTMYRRAHQIREWRISEERVLRYVNERYVVSDYKTGGLLRLRSP